MAQEKGGGPGTETRGGVRGTFTPPFAKGSDKGSQVNIPGSTFDHPRSGGDNGLPTRVTDDAGGMAPGPKPGSPFTSPSSQGPNRPGTVQNKY